MCGAYIGLCLPRSSVAAWAASLPSTTSVASITCQAWVMSPGFGLYVDTDLPRCCRVPERHPQASARTMSGARVRRGRPETGPRSFTHCTSKNERTRRSEAGSKRPPPHRRLPPTTWPRSPPAGGVEALRPLVAVVRRANRHADLGEHGREIGRRRVPLLLPKLVILRGRALPGGDHRREEAPELVQLLRDARRGARHVRLRGGERPERDLDLRPDAHRGSPLPQPSALLMDVIAAVWSSSCRW